MSLTAAEQEALEAHLQALREAFGERLERVILYGSKARGDDHEESDIDLLAVVSGSVALQDIYTGADVDTAVLVDAGVYMETVVLSHEEFEHPQGEVRWLVEAAQAEGVAL